MTRPLALTRLRAVAPLTYEQTVMADSPIAFWRFNEAAGAATFADSSGNGRTATIVNTVTSGGASKNSRLGNMAAMAATSYLTATSAPFRLTGNMSLSFWIRLASTLTTGQVVYIASCAANGETSATNALYLVALLNNGGTQQFQNFHENGSGTNNSANINVTYTATQWNHFAMTRDVSINTYRLYLNGALVNSNTYTNDPDGGGSTNFEIGRDAGQPTASSIARDLDELAIFNTVLSAERIFEHYRAGRRAA